MAKTSTISYSPVIEKRPQIVKTKRAAIYIRCSSDEAKKEGYSPETQENTSARAINIDGNKLNEECIYKDIGYSGGTDKRPGLQKLLDDARAKKFDIVYVSRSDRFFRNLPLLIETVNELKSLGVEFKSASEPFDTTTPTGKAMFQMAGVFAEWQRDVGLEAMREGVIKAIQDGKWVNGGNVPYGYKFNKRTHRAQINEKEAKIVRIIFEWVAYEKLSKYKVQKKLNETKIPTKYDNLGRRKNTNGFGWWNVRTIDRILKYKTYYTGESEYHRKSNDGKQKRLIIKVPPIITKELFELAQEQLKKNQKISPRHVKEVYALRHKLYCGIDGWRYYAFYEKPKESHYKGRKFYRCSGKNRYIHATYCPSEEISENRILPPVWKKLKELFNDPEVVMEEFQKYSNERSKRRIIEENLAKIDNSLQVVQKKKERTVNLYLEGYINEEVCKKKLDGHKELEENYQREKQKLSQFLMKEEEEKSRVASISELRARLKDSIKHATYETQCQIIAKIIERITVKGNELEIECNFPNLPEEVSVKQEKYAPKFYSDTRGSKRKSWGGN